MKTQKTLQVFACDEVQVKDKVFSVEVDKKYHDTKVSFVFVETDMPVRYMWTTSLARGPSVLSYDFIKHLSKGQFA